MLRRTIFALSASIIIGAAAVVPHAALAQLPGPPPGPPPVGPGLGGPPPGPPPGGLGPGGPLGRAGPPPGSLPGRGGPSALPREAGPPSRAGLAGSLGHGTPRSDYRVGTAGYGSGGGYSGHGYDRRYGRWAGYGAAYTAGAAAGYGYGNSGYDSYGCYRTYSSRRHSYVTVCD